LADFSVRHFASQDFTEILGESEYGKQSPEIFSSQNENVVKMEIKRTGLLGGVNDISLCAFVVTQQGTVTHISTPNEEGKK
jgi:hypothetical protein